MFWIIFSIAAVIVIAIIVIRIIVIRNDPTYKYRNLNKAENSRQRFIETLSPEDKSDYIRKEISP